MLELLTCNAVMAEFLLDKNAKTAIVAVHSDAEGITAYKSYSPTSSVTLHVLPANYAFKFPDDKRVRKGVCKFGGHVFNIWLRVHMQSWEL